MKEIKFRAWDEIEQVMYSKMNPYAIKEHQKIMQYMEFKDKNMNEIYEGDFVLIKGETKITMGYIELSSKYGFILNGHVPKGDFKIEDITNIYKLPHLPNFYFYDDLEIEENFGTDILTNVEVVGNIHKLSQEEKIVWGIK